MEAPSGLEADLGWDRKNGGHILQREADIHEFLWSHDAGKALHREDYTITVYIK